MDQNRKPQEQVFEIWAETLGVESVGPDSHFFELGGDSLAVTKMSLRVEALTGVIAPDGIVYSHPSAQAYLDALPRNHSEKGLPYLTPVQTEGEKRPLFLIPPASGGIFNFRELVSHLHDSQPCYCVTPRIASNGEHQYDSLRHLASLCLEAMFSIQAQGPYQIMGYSFGGVIAWEIARQLELAGQTVDVLILCDSRGEVDRGDVFKLVAISLDSHRRHRKWPSFTNIGHLLYLKVLNHFRSRPKSAQGQTPEITNRGGREDHGLGDGYEFGTYSGEVVILRSRKQRTLGVALDYELGWKSFLKSVPPTVLDIPGNHFDILKEPAVSIVGSILNERIDQAAQSRADRIAQEIIDSDQAAPLPFHEPSPGISIVDRLQTVTQAGAKKVAIRDGGKVLTYGDLDRISSQLAGEIVSQFGSEIESVILYLPNSWQFTVAIYAVLKAGKFYVPIDSESYSDRTKRIIQSAGSRLALCLRTDASALQEEDTKGGFEIQIFEDLLVQSERLDLEAIYLPLIEPFQPAALLFTSGSTGAPKGIVISHSMVVHVSWRRSTGAKYLPSDRYMQVYSSSFMGSLMATHGAILSGICLCIYRLQRRGIDSLAAWIVEERITIFHAVTSIYRKFLASLESLPYHSKIRIIHPGGEQSRTSDIENFKKAFPRGVTYFTSLGSTECGTMGLNPVTHETPTTINNIPVASIAGLPFPSLETKILNEAGEEVPQGSIGEIVVESRFILSAYVTDDSDPESRKYGSCPELKTHPTGDFGYFNASKQLVNLGRRDSQVKINGTRVDLLEIESALAGIAGVGESAVSLRSVAGMDGGKTPSNAEILVAFYTLADAVCDLNSDTIRASLHALLPTAMIPTKFVKLDQLPFKTGGKLDRKRLKSLTLDGELGGVAE